jgi:outer membrane lipoprotein carrier protein
MKKFILMALLCLVNPLYALASGAADAELLKEKLAKFSQINAEFSQVVSNSEGEVLNKSQGKLTVLRPGKFRWEVSSPEEELIVSDGKTMWFYSPFIEQVTLYNLSDAVADTPFVLLSGANEKQWQNYLVSRDNNQFTVKGSDPEVQQNSFVFEFDAAGNISKFVIIDEQGQRSEFKLTHKPLTEKLEAGYFDFQIPQGVEIDDQR